FSSRRRHTRSKRDWSSDVCSSDLDGHHKFASGLDPKPQAQVAAKVRRPPRGKTHATADRGKADPGRAVAWCRGRRCPTCGPAYSDRKSTRLNSSHVSTSYADFCWK